MSRTALRRWTLACGASLLPLSIHAASAAPAAETAAAPDAPTKSYVTPALEIVGFDLLLSRFNRHFSGSSDYDVTWASIQRNLQGPWVVDNDPFKINQFGHPYQGSLYHGAGRASGLNYWEAAALTFAGSAWWEITGERTPPSRNDQIASGIAGSFLGEPLFRIAHLMLKESGGLPYVWREWAAAAVSPAVGFNRLAFGSRFDGAFDDHDPFYDGRLRIGSSRAVRNDIGTSTQFKSSATEADFALDYGLPGRPDYTYRRPFDYFSLRAMYSSANGVEDLGIRGLLFGTTYGLGDVYRGIWGLYANYDYLAPQVFHLSTTALSLGTTGQWWVTKNVALQGTGQAGFGYSAASTSHGVADDRDYHYGVAPRLSLDLRMTAGSSVLAEVSAQKYLLGRIANRSAGKDDIARVDAAFTWRLSGRHAIGTKYVWAHRSASYPTIGDRRQTLGTVGVFYSLLGEDSLRAIDWRESAGR